MHVLAHVRASAHLAPSTYDATYIAFAARAIGVAEERNLAEDARAIGQLAATHDALVHAQLVAWLFRTKDRARACAGRALAELRAEDVDAPALLAAVARASDAAELVWCAALLEDEAHARLPEIAIDDARVATAIDAMIAVAPELAECEIAILPALRLRGRVSGAEIWIGAPCEELALSIDHVAWQAAHEATVREVSRANDERLAHDPLERSALELLARRARDAGIGDRHAEWRARFAT